MSKILRQCSYLLPYGLVRMLRHANELVQLYRARQQGHWGLPERRHDRCLIVAGGPSVNEVYDEMLEYRKYLDVVTVNMNILKEALLTLNPMMHICIDPCFNNPEAKNWEICLKVYEKLNSFSTKCYLCVTHDMYKGIKERITNENIEIISLSIYTYSGSEKIGKRLLPKGLVSFGGQNVVVAALYMALMMGYEKIFLAGLDMDEEYSVDENCTIYRNYKHFYDKTRTAHQDYLLDFHLAPLARMYEELSRAQQYAKRKGVEIINLSRQSSVDIFCKGELNGKVYPFKPPV